MFVCQDFQCIGGVAGPAVSDLVVAGDETRDVGHRRAHQCEPLRCRCDRPRPHLLPGHARDHQHHKVEVQGMTHVHRSDEMPDVRWIEGAAEEPDSQGAGR